MSWFRKKNRGLFEFHDGISRRYADPFKVMRALVLDEDLRPDDFALAQVNDNRTAAESQQRIDAALRRAFDLREFDDRTGAGLSSAELLAMFARFEEFVDALKKNGSEPLTLQEPTDSATPATEQTAKRES